MDELQKRFTEGDINAFEALFRAHQKEVYRWILRMVRDPATAEDLTVETFWRAYRSAGRFDPERSFGAWVRTIAVNRARKHLARQNREVGVENLARYSAPSSVAGDFQGNELRGPILQAFQLLPERLRVVALLALIEDMPYREISIVMGISLGAVKTRVFRAVRKLRKELDKVGIRP
ncbi:MAG TPA: sigma-70 family RNA polymerase sigma factor [Pyrinomonadaceae bacterium]|nr:sigma-70 family RNA polymerase sigma factor [Pyrinomonadaceae bacterium]